MMKSKIFLAVLFYFIFFSVEAQQQAEIELGNSTIYEGSYYSITAKIPSNQADKVPSFPELPGFTKSGLQKGSHTSWINGVVSSYTVITQRYIPKKIGEYHFTDLPIVIGNKKYTIKELDIKVVERSQQRSTNRPRSLYEELFGMDPYGNRQPAPQQFKEVPSVGVLSMRINKREVYRGEPIHLEVSFYIPYNKRNYVSLSQENLYEINELMQKNRPANCWEERIDYDDVTSVETTNDGGRIVKYKLFEAVYYPINTEDVNFKSVELKLPAVTEISTQRPSFFNQQQVKREMRAFRTRSTTVKVRDLPEHPLKDQVAVGNYFLDETISKDSLETAESINYSFKIEGEGNINTIETPTVVQNEGLEFFDPNSTQNIVKSDGKVYGNKQFDYYIIPQEPGEYDLGNYIKWIYFNFKTEKYDTLVSEKEIYVGGESLMNASIETNDFGAFYDLINTADNTIISNNQFDTIKWVVNTIAFGLAIGLTVVFIRHRRKEKNG